MRHLRVTSWFLTAGLLTLSPWMASAQSDAAKDKKDNTPKVNGKDDANKGSEKKADPSAPRPDSSNKAEDKREPQDRERQPGQPQNPNRDASNPPTRDPNAAPKNPLPNTQGQDVEPADRRARGQAAPNTGKDPEADERNDRPKAPDAAIREASENAARSDGRKQPRDNAAADNKANASSLREIFGGSNAEKTQRTTQAAGDNVGKAAANRQAARIAADFKGRNDVVGTTQKFAGADVNARQASRTEYATAIRRGMAGKTGNVFTSRWWGANKNAWGGSWSNYQQWNTRFGNGTNAQANGFGSVWPWRSTEWTALNTFRPNYWGQPIAYDYGSNVYYQDNMVYFDGRPVVSVTDYATSARRLATSGSADPNNPEDWTPLGVFAIADQNGADPSLYFQMALNKNGAIGGNFYNADAERSEPIRGAVDQKSQRAAWTIGSSEETVFETGLYNLTQSETSVMAHRNNGQDQMLFMVRLEQPAIQESSAQPTSATQP